MTLLLIVQEIKQQTPGIRSYVLVSESGGSLPEFTAGAHIKVSMSNGITRQYSLVNGPEEKSSYTIAVLHDAQSLGGSSWMHGHLQEGDKLQVSEPVNQFELSEEAKHHLLIAGGIGITPILAMAKYLHSSNQSFRICYCTRSIESTAFYADLLAGPFFEKIKFIHDQGDLNQRLDLSQLLVNQRASEHVYFCGPQGFIQAGRDATSHWIDSCVHYELFSAETNRKPNLQPDVQFRVQIDSTGEEYVIPVGSSVLEVLGDNGIGVDHLCKEGYCGSCLTGVLQGIPDHRDSVQTNSEKADNDFMTLCCSRSKTDLLVLDL
ncbi:MAG: vanillate O-demethylase ferredoxin subunit [Parasphingorhabdus sp.]|jgi:vanillate O-demethylase ferredoxin subunit